METRVLLPDDIEPLEYNLHISTNLEGDFKFKGEVAIELIVKKKTKFIRLHGKDIEIVDAVLTDNDINVNPISTEYDTFDDIITFTFEKELEPSNKIFKVNYIGLHNDVMDGFYRSMHPGRNGESKVMVSTKFEPIACRRCLPCIDEPARKAFFTCSLEVDKGLTVLSNMPEIKRESVSDTREKVSFSKSPKMSTYLLAFVVGEFDFIEATTSHDVKLRVYAPIGKIHLGNFALDCGVKALDLYDDMFGKPFPLPKMDMIAIPEFASGAMENWGLITYRETALLVGDDASSSQKQRVATVVAHELAHMWFGNLVTMQWWDDLWLNEGFATWMQNYAADKVFPDWKLWDQFVVNNQGSALSLDSMQSSHPVQVRIDRAQKAGEIFDLISYQKGSCVVRLAYHYLGEEDFKKGLQLYMAKHEFQNTETVDLWKAWAEASQKPVSKVMSSWTEQQGFPVITVVSETVKNKICTLELSQEWFLADGSVPEQKTWSIPMFIQTEKGHFKLDTFSDSKTTVSVEVGGLGWIKLNAGQVVPLHVNYSERLWRANIEGVLHQQIAPIEICGLLTDIYALVKAKRASPSILIDLIEGLNNTLDYPVWSVLDSILKSLNSALSGSKLHKPFAGLAKALLLSSFAKIGWDKKPEDTHLDGMLRGLLVSELATFSRTDEEVVKIAREKYAEYIKDQDTKALPAEYKTVVLRIVLANAEDDSVFNTLMDLAGKVTSAIAKRDIYVAIGFGHTPELKERAMNWALSGEVKLQDYFFVFASVCLSGPEGVAQAWKFFKANFEKLSELLKDGSERMLGAGITYSTYGFNSFEDAKDIENFFSTRDSRNERRVEQIVEGIRNKASFKELLLNSKDLAESLNVTTS